MSSGWTIFIALITLGTIFGSGWLLWRYSSLRGTNRDAAGPETTGHVWDEDLREYNNPLPRWWMWLFYGTLVFSLVYLVLYPGLGGWPGLLGWSQEKRYEDERRAWESRVEDYYARFRGLDWAQLAADPQAVETGRRLFLNECAACHGSDARGAPGFPNLTDEEWLWGGTPEAIFRSIADGRTGVMPAWSAALGEDGVQDMVHWVRRLAGLPHDAAAAARAQPKFAMFCAACHGPDGRGNPAVGAPDLSNDVWLYGADPRNPRRNDRPGAPGADAGAPRPPG
ncbi:MAG: Cbb3-type cytochrome c oxidase subunit [Gammaproteobacteria bacterium]|nr:MAG: Cbb3-type cytochrome c oxidase subunit [Gammaproteobacteria bacterium]